mgnify:FL=1
MTALTKATPLPDSLGDLARFDQAAVAAYQGGAVGLNSSGYARMFALGDTFKGHANESKDNAAGSAGGVKLETQRGRYIKEIPLSGVAITDAVRQAPVFVTDSGGYSLRKGLYCGRVVQYMRSGYALVEFDDYSQIGVIAETMLYTDFTDNTNTTGYMDFTTAIPAGCMVLGWQADVRTGFTGDTTATVQVGVSGSIGRFSAITNSSCLAAGNVGSQVPGSSTNAYCPSATTSRVTVTGAADFTSISAGEMDIRIAYLQLLRM